MRVDLALQAFQFILLKPKLMLLQIVFQLGIMLNFLDRALDILSHLIERIGEKRDFIVRFDLDGVVVIA